MTLTSPSPPTEFSSYQSSSLTSTLTASTSSSSSSVASQDNTTTTIVVAFSSTVTNGYTSSVPIAYLASSGVQTPSTLATDLTSATSSSSSAVPTIYASSVIFNNSVQTTDLSSSASSSSSIPVQGYTSSTANFSASTNNPIGSATASSLSAGNVTSVSASIPTDSLTSYPVLVTVYTASGQSQTTSLGQNNTSNTTVGGYQTPTSGPFSGTAMSGHYSSSAGTGSLGFPSQANATGGSGTLVYSLVLPSSSAGTAVSGFPFQVNATGGPGTFVYSLILSSTPASGYASASGVAGSSGTGTYGYGMGSASGSYNLSTMVGSAVSQASVGTISGYPAYNMSQSNAGSGSLVYGTIYTPAQTTSSPLGNGSGNSSISCYGGNETNTGRFVTIICVPGTPGSLSSGGYLQQGSTLASTGTSILPGSYASSVPGYVPVFVPQGEGTPGSGSSGMATIVVTLTITRCGACANSATGTPDSLSSGATSPATGVIVAVSSTTSFAYGYISSLAPQPQSTPVGDYSGPATVVVSLTMTQCGGCASASVVPVYTPGMLGNAYGGGYISTPSVYGTVSSPSDSGSAVGVPPGYGYSLQPGSPTAGSQTVYSSAVAAPVSSVAPSVGSLQGSGSSSGTTTSIVQPGSPTASGTPTTSSQSVYSSVASTAPPTSVGSSAGLPQGYGPPSLISGTPTAGSQSAYNSAVSMPATSSTGSSAGALQGYGSSSVSGNPTTIVQPGSPTASGTPSAGSPSIYNSLVSASPVSSAGLSVGPPQVYGSSSLIYGAPTTIVQSSGPTSSDTRTTIIQAGPTTISGQASSMSAPPAYPAASSRPSATSVQGYGYSFVPGNPTPVLVPISGTAVGTPTTIVETATPTSSGQSPYTSVILSLPALPPGYGYSPQIEATGSASGSSIHIGQSVYPSGIATAPASPKATGSAGSAGGSTSGSTSSTLPGGVTSNGGVGASSGSNPYSGSGNSGNISVPVNPSALATYEGSAMRHFTMGMVNALLVCLATLYVL